MIPDPKVLALAALFVTWCGAGFWFFSRFIWAMDSGRWWSAASCFACVYGCACAAAWCTVLIGDRLPY